MTVQGIVVDPASVSTKLLSATNAVTVHVVEALRDQIWKEIASEALARLERDVREYIRWARSQGMP